MFIHSGYFYSASSRPLLHRGVPDTAQTLCRSFTPKRHKQLQVKDLHKVPRWQLGWSSNPRPFGRKRKGDESTNELPHPTMFTWCYQTSEKSKKNDCSYL